MVVGQYWRVGTGRMLARWKWNMHLYPTPLTKCQRGQWALGNHNRVMHHNLPSEIHLVFVQCRTSGGSEFNGLCRTETAVHKVNCPRGAGCVNRITSGEWMIAEVLMCAQLSCFGHVKYECFADSKWRWQRADNVVCETLNIIELLHDVEVYTDKYFCRDKIFCTIWTEISLYPSFRRLIPHMSDRTLPVSPLRSPPFRSLPTPAVIMLIHVSLATANLALTITLCPEQADRDGV